MKMPLSEAKKLWPDFDTFGDPKLEKMLIHCAEFWASMKLKECPPYWLSLVGGSGTGKTFLAQKLYMSAKLDRNFAKHAWMTSPVKQGQWMDLFDQIIADSTILNDLAAANFLLIDELTFPRNREGEDSEYSVGRLIQLLSHRMNKWTVITANTTARDLGMIDARITSRMIRDGNKLVRVEAIDYWLRKNKS